MGDDSFTHVLTAIKLAREDSKANNRQGGEIECPKCKGKVLYSIARSNGHVHGRCKTEGCLAWMM